MRVTAQLVVTFWYIICLFIDSDVNNPLNQSLTFGTLSACQKYYVTHLSLSEFSLDYPWGRQVILERERKYLSGLRTFRQHLRRLLAKN